MKPNSYAVTRGCNSKTQHWRGELRGYAVTSSPQTCVCAGAGACVPAGVCTWGVRVTA